MSNIMYVMSITINGLNNKTVLQPSVHSVVTYLAWQREAALPLHFPVTGVIKGRTCSSDALTSDLLFQAEDHRHGLVQHQQLGLWLFTLQVQLTHVAQLLEGLINVPHTKTFPGVVGHPPLTLTFGLLLRSQVLILIDASMSRRCKKILIKLPKNVFLEFLFNSTLLFLAIIFKLNNVMSQGIKVLLGYNVEFDALCWPSSCNQSPIYDLLPNWSLILKIDFVKYCV